MPLRNQIHVDKLLSNMSLKYQSPAYIHDRVFPALPVKNRSDLYRIYVRHFRLVETNRAEKGLAREASFEYTSGSYQLEKHALKDYVSEDEQENNDIGDLRADTVEFLMDKILLRREVSCANLFTSTNWSNNVSLAAANAFSANTTVSNPIPVFDTANSTVLKQSGMKPNFGILPLDGFIAAKNHTSIAERVKYVSKDITKEMLAGLFDIPELLVPAAQRDTAAEGVTESLSNVWPDHAFVGFKALSPGLRQVSAGYMLTKKGVAGTFVRRWNDEEREDAEAIEVNSNHQFKVVASLAGYLIKDIV